MKGAPFFNGRYTKGVLFGQKWYIPNSIKVALGIGQLRIGKLLFGGHSSKALHCVPYAQMPNAQLPMTNCQSNLF